MTERANATVGEAKPEAWLAGPIDGVPAALQPVAHALLHARADAARALDAGTPGALEARPGGAASAAYHLRHLAGSLDRLLTYARGESLSQAQLAALAEEKTERAHAYDDMLRPLIDGAFERALEQVRATTDADLGAPRAVGRARLPSTVRALLFHAAEHSARHAGQAVTTVLVARGAVSGRHTLRSLTVGAIGRVLDLDRGFLHTARRLTVGPGPVIRDYLAGRTASYTHPVAYLLIAFAAFALIGELFDLNVRGGGSDNRFFSALVVPFVAGVSWLLFRRARLNYAEHLILTMYLIGHVALLAAFLQLAIPFLLASLLLIQALLIATLVAGTGYFVWGYSRVFATRPVLAAIGALASLWGGILLWAMALVSIVRIVQG